MIIKMPMIKTIILVTFAFLLNGCASQGPVLYPNEHLKMVGEPQAHKDIEECDQLAAEYVKSDAGKEAAKSTVGGATAGTLVGAAGGAVVGDLGRGSLIGAATGATAGLIRGISKASQPSPIYKRFVEKCLQDKGYEPIGWE